MVQPGLARPHRVLVAAEQRQALGDEALQRDCSACSRVTGQAKLSSRPGVAGEARLDQRDHLARDGIGLEAPCAAARRPGRRRRRPRGCRRRSSTGRLRRLVARPSARRGACAARGRSTPCAATCGPCACAANSRTLQKKWRSSRMSSGRPWPRATALIACSTRQSPGAVITRPAGRRRSMSACNCAARLPRLAGVVEPRVVQRPAGGAQGQREVAHRGQEHHRARLARPHVRRFLGHLGHPDRVARGIEAVERGGVEVELVAQHERPGGAAQPRAALAAPAGVGAVLHLGPVAGPAAAPAHRPAAGHAGLAGQGGLVAAE